MIINEDKIIEKNQEHLALACLLADQVVFMNTIKTGFVDDEWNLAIFVMCSDVFLWGTADAESISNSDYQDGSEIIDLYKRWKENSEWGPVKWCCVKRNMKPQAPMVKLMKEENVWDDEMENLPKNEYE